MTTQISSTGSGKDPERNLSFRALLPNWMTSFAKKAKNQKPLKNYSFRPMISTSNPKNKRKKPQSKSKSSWQEKFSRKKKRRGRRYIRKGPSLNFTS